MLESIGKAVIRYQTRILEPLFVGGFSGLVPEGIKQIFKTLSEIVTLVDNVSITVVTVFKHLAKTITETQIEISETILDRLATKARTITQTTTISDVASRIRAKAVSVPTQSITILDAVTRTLLGPTGGVEIINITDEAVITRRQKIRTVAEAQTQIFDSVSIESPQIAVEKTLTDTVAVGGGTVAILRTKAMVLEESVPFSSESIRRNIGPSTFDKNIDWTDTTFDKGEPSRGTFR